MNIFVKAVYRYTLKKKLNKLRFYLSKDKRMVIGHNCGMWATPTPDARWFGINTQNVINALAKK